MPDKPANNRPQINVRLDKEPGLLNEIKKAASDRNITSSVFLLDAIKSALGKPTTSTPAAVHSLEFILAEVDKILDAKLDLRLGELEGRMLAQFRQIDRRQPPEVVIQEDRQAIPEARPETRPDYQAIRDRVLKSLITGRGRIATSAPQYKSAAKALDRFISEIEVVAQLQELKEHIQEAVPDPEISPVVELPKENSEPDKKRGRTTKQSN